jgi:putative membrane protein
MQIPPWLEKRWMSLVVIIMFFVGIISHIFEPTRDLMLLITPFFLLLMGLFVLYPSFKEEGRKFILWCLVAYIITFIIEAAGVWTGLIFGEYTYGDSLGLKLFDVPLVIGFNWVIVIIGSAELTKRFTRNVLLGALITGLSATIFDFIMEPVAMELDYWDWAGGTIPIQNYIAWFVIALVMGWTYLKFQKGRKKEITIHYLLVQTIFFLVLRIFLVGH